MFSFSNNTAEGKKQDLTPLMFSKQPYDVVAFDKQGVKVFSSYR